MSRKRQHSDQSFHGPSESDDTDDSIPIKRSKGHWDPYCWICHEANTNRRCSTCIRSYHNECIGSKEAAKPEDKYRCELCIRMYNAKEDYNKRRVNMEHIHKLLEHVTKRLLDDDEFKCFAAGTDFSQLRQPNTGGPNIINPFDLSIVEEKILDRKYKTTLEFINDIRWIRHNAEIMLNETDARLEIARNMEELCDLEMYDIEMCGECFNRATTVKKWFTAVCNPPHLLVWARMHGHPYWPGKVIGLSDSGNNKIDVRFFGTHDRQNILISDCLLFSDNPNKRLDQELEDEIDAAMKEAERYIKNIEAKHECIVVRARPRSQFSVQQVGRYLNDMIPGLNLSRDYKLKRKPLYLRKYRRRKGPNPLKRKSDKLCVEKAEIKTKECEVRLEKCDDMIAMILGSQEMKDGPDDMHHHEEDDKHEKDETNIDGCEQIECEQIDFEPDNLQQNDSDDDESEKRILRAMQHVNQYDLVINLTENNDSCGDSGASSMCFDISSDSSDVEMEVDQLPSSVEKTINLASEVDENPLEIRKDPSPRTYGKLYRRKTISDDDSTSTTYAEQSLSHSPFIARKSYGTLHTTNLAIRKEVARPENDAPDDNGEPNIENVNDTMKSLEPNNPNYMDAVVVPGLFEDLDDGSLFSDVNFEPEPLTQSTFGPGAPSHIASKQIVEPEQVRKQTPSPQVPEEAPEKISEPKPELITESQAIQSNVANMKRMEEVSSSSDNDKQSVASKAINENDKNEQDHDNSSITDQPVDTENKSPEQPDQNEIQPTENLPINDTAGAATENPIASELNQNLLPPSNTSVNESPAALENEPAAIVENESSTVVMDTTSLAQDKFQLLEENFIIHENLILVQKAELLEKENEINDLKSQLAKMQEVASQVAQLKNLKLKHEQEMLKLKQDHQQEIVVLKTEHDAQLQKAIDETKSKQWCSVCRKEANVEKFHVSVCSRECLRKLWDMNKEPSNPMAQDQVHVNGQVLLSTHVEISASNGCPGQNSSNVDDSSFSEIHDY